MKITKIMVSLLAGLALITGCQPKEQEPAKISVNPAAVEFEQTAGTKTVTVVSNYVWEAVCDAQWISITPAKGEATTGTTVTISALANETTEARSASVTFYCNNSRLTSASVTVKQKAKEVVIETLTVAEFIKRADTETEYRLVGKISNIATAETYKAFNLTDATGTVLVFFPENFEEYASRLATGGTVTVRGKYEYFASKSQHELVDGTIESYEKPQEEDPTKVKQITVAEFIQKADEFTTYRLVGTVNSKVDEQYCSFDLKDATGTVKIYQVKNASEWLGKVKQGGTVTVRGKYQLYVKGETKTHEMVDAYIEKFEEAKPAEEKETAKIADILNDEDGVIYTLKGATVVADYEKGYLVTDGTDHILVYTNAPDNPIEGTKVDAKGTISTYGGFKQIGGTVTTTEVGTGEVPTVNPEDITSTFDSFPTNKIKKIKYSGTLTVSKGSSTTYYNVTVDGATRKGSISYPSPDWELDAHDGMSVEVEGWFVGTSSSSSAGEFLNMMLTAYSSFGSYFNVSPTEITAKASETSAEFKISSNVKWTVTSDNTDFVVSQTSGENTETIEVTFPENAGTEAKVANITVKTTESEVAVKEYVVKITQKAPSQGGYESNVAWGDLKDAYSDKAEIEGEEYDVLKIGKSKADGSASLTIPSGTKKVTFYAIGWKGTKASLKIENGDKTLFSGEVKANDGASGNSPYTISKVSSDDQYSFEFDSALTAETKLTIASTNNSRVILFGINASK